MSAFVTYLLMNTKYQKALDLLSKQLTFTSEEARKNSIPSRMLAHFCQQGIIERIGRGIYKHSHFESSIHLEYEDLIATCSSIPEGVICLTTALYLYGYTDQMLREYWIAVPNSQKSPKRTHTRVVRMRNITLGLTTIQLGSVNLKIFDRERTVLDAFRFLSDEIAIKALQFYLKDQKHKPNLAKLAQDGKLLKVKITPYILALTT